MTSCRVANAAPAREDREPDPAEAILERRAGEPEEQHVSDQVHPAGVDERRRDQVRSQAAAGLVAEPQDRNRVRIDRHHRAELLDAARLEERIEIGREQGRVELDQRADRDDGEGQVRNAADVRSWPYGMIKAGSLLAPLRVRSRWVTGSPGTRPRAELSLADLLAV